MRRKRPASAPKEVLSHTAPLEQPGGDSLWASEERLRLLIEGIKDCAIFMLDPEGRIALWNQGAQRLYGYLEEEMLGRDFAGLYPPEEAQAGQPAVNLQKAAQGGFQGEGWRARKDGSRFWADVIISPVQNQAGKLAGFAKITRDITRRHQAEEALRASEERYRRIVETAGDGIWLLDQNLKTLLVNGRMAHILGCQPDELIGRHVSDFMDQEGQRFASGLMNGGEKGLPERREIKFVRGDGTPVWTMVTTNAFTTKSGEFLGVLALVADITERERLDAALREAHQRLQTIIHASPLAILTTDAAGRIVSWNEGAERMFGWSEQEVINKTCPTVPSEGLEDYRAMVSDVMRGRTITGLVRYRQKKDGTGIHASLSSAPLRNDAGAVTGTIIMLEDISERQRVEEAMQQMNARLQAILGASPIPILGVAADGRIESWNEAAERVFGWSAGEAVGRLCPTVGPREMEDYLEMIRRAMQGEPSLGLVRYRQKKDSSLRLCRISAAPQRNAQGQSVGVTVLLEDVTEQAQAEAALRESEERFSGAFKYAAIGMALVAPDGRWLQVNRSLCEQLGYSEAELLAATFQQITHPDDLDKDLAHVRQMLAGEIQTYQMEKRYFHKSGDIVWGLLSVSLVRNNQGMPRYFVSQIQDITAHKKSEAALHQLSGQLLRLQDEEHRRLARELHDSTAQKLAVLLLGLRRLTAQASSMEAGARETLAECHALAEQCANEVRTFSYLLHPPLLEELGLAGAVRDYADGFAQRSGVRVDLEVSPNLERLPREKELALFRVLQESLANVHRHSGSKTVSIRLAQLRGETRLEVQDAGRGLEPKTGPASGEKAPSRLGVGVAGMRERMRQLGGRLEFESGHRGTTVRASLPLDQPGSEHADDKNPDCG